MIKHYVIKIVSDRSMVSPDNPASSPNKTDRHDIAEILLKVALHTINLNQNTAFSDSHRRERVWTLIQKTTNH